MSNDERPYSVFVSYARRDDIGGWVSTLIDALKSDSQRLGDNHRIFFDQSDPRSFEEWRSGLRHALRRSQVLMVCVSQAYFNSDPCLWEWLEHEIKATAPDLPVAVVPVFLEDTSHGVPDDEPHRKWRAKVYSVHGRLDLRRMFSLDPTVVSTDELIAQVRTLGNELYERREAVRRGERSGTNLAKGTGRFVGRSDELAELGEALATTGAIGVVTAVQGIGGIGKTELVRQYGHRNQAAFPAGVWQLAAEHHTQMLPLLASLANDLPGFTIPDDLRSNPTEIGRLVRSELVSRTGKGQPVLLILDNVSELALLSPAEIGELPAVRQFHITATTRLGPGDFLGNTRLAHVPIGGLSHPASVELFRLHQFDLTGDGEPDFRTPDDETAAHELATLLGGFTLAVELAAVYLMTHPEISIRDYLDFLQGQGVTGIDDLSDSATIADLHHQDAVLRVVIDSMLNDVDATVPGAALVLRLAAAMPPDSVAWPWLEHLGRELDPSIFEPSPQDLSGRWMRIRRALEGRGLIEEGRHPGETGRIHRLIALHLTDPDLNELVDTHTLERAKAIGDSWDQPDAWELDTTLDALNRPLNENPDRLERITAFFEDTLVRYPSGGRHQLLLDNVRHNSSGRTQLVACGILGGSLQNEDPVRALRLFQDALTVAVQFADAQPDNLQAQRDHSVSLEKVGDMLRSQDPDQALTHYQESLKISQQLAEKHPDDLQAQRDHSVSLEKVGDMLRSQDPDQALTHYQESLKISQQLAEKHPDDLQAQRDHSVSLEKVGDMLRSQDPDQALNHYQESLAVRQRMAADYPNDLQARRDLTISLDRIGDTLTGKDPNQALTHYQESLDITRRLAEDSPNDLQARRDLTISLEKIGDMMANYDPDQALTHYQESSAVRRRLAADYPDDLQARRDLTISLIKVGDLLASHDPDQALNHYQESSDIARRLAGDYPDNLQAQRDSSVSLDRVGDVLRSRDPNQALTHYQESLAIRRRLAEDHPDNLQAGRDLSISLNKIAWMHHGDDPRQAYELHLHSLEIRRNLARRSPSIQSLQDQGISAAQAAQLLDPSSEPAQRLWNEAAICLRQAWRAIPDDPILAQQAWALASNYLRCQPDDVTEWQPVVNHLAKRFGFE